MRSSYPAMSRIRPFTVFLHLFTAAPMSILHLYQRRGLQLMVRYAVPAYRLGRVATSTTPRYRRRSNDSNAPTRPAEPELIAHAWLGSNAELCGAPISSTI